MARTVSYFVTTANKPEEQRPCLLDTVYLHFLPPQKEKLGSRGFLFTFSLFHLSFVYSLMNVNVKERRCKVTASSVTGGNSGRHTKDDQKSNLGA
jgi:hypothetical protein